ncbi:uncharacterized protein LOC134258049 [Saccostrea cucullata]|uniref:uncharacterized protein LOC134258049 n=1 Tax=Saccostrea cuccullata TaxID=36930 RepID=UPI002ED3C920
MGKKNKSASRRQKYAKHDYEKMKMAYDAVKSGKLSLKKAAEKFGVKKSTLYDRVSGKIDVYASSGRKPALNPEIEKRIVDNVTQTAEKGFGISRQQLLSRTGILCNRLKLNCFVNKQPTKHWWYGFKSRHPEISLRKPEKLGTVRARMLNGVVVQRYFNDLGKIIENLNLQNAPKKIWNADETGKQLEHSPVNVVARKGTKNVVGRTSTDRSNITIMACVNASGEKMPPMLVVKGKTKKSLYGYNTAEAPENSMWTFNDRAWMDEELGEQWFKNVFIPNCGNERPQLLILDGHGSHETLGLLELADQEGIHVLALPPHTTHFLQPLDRSVFGPFNKAYNKFCSDFLSQNAAHVINKWTFPSLFKKAWEEGITAENIVSGFRACGIYPFDPQAIPESAYLPSSAYDIPQNSAPTTPDLSQSINTATVTAEVHNVPDPTYLTSPDLSQSTNKNTATVTSEVHNVPTSLTSLDLSQSTNKSTAAVTVEIHNVPTSLTSLDLSQSTNQNTAAVTAEVHNVPTYLNSPDLSQSANKNTVSVTAEVHNVSTYPTTPDLSDSIVPIPDVVAETQVLESINDLHVLPSDILENPVPAAAVLPTEAGEFESKDANSQSEIENPEHLLTLINMGLIEVVQNPEVSEEVELNTSFWNTEIDNIFTPVAAVQSSEKKPKSRAITSHRLLTSSAIIQEKREKLEKKQKLEEQKQERKRKREEKRMIKENKGKNMKI